MYCALTFELGFKSNHTFCSRFNLNWIKKIYVNKVECNFELMLKLKLAKIQIQNSTWIQFHWIWIQSYQDWALFYLEEFKLKYDWIYDFCHLSNRFKSDLISVHCNLQSDSNLKKIPHKNSNAVWICLTIQDYRFEYDVQSKTWQSHPRFAPKSEVC